MLHSDRPIVHVIGELAAAGAEIFVKELCLALQKKEAFPVEVWTLYKADRLHPGDQSKIAVEKGFLEAFQSAGIRVRQLDKRPGKDYVKTWRGLRRFARAARPALVHCHLEEVSFHVCLALGSSGLPIVQTMHNQQVRRPGLYRNFFSRRCRAFVAISSEVKAQTQAAMPDLSADRIVDIPNGIPFEAFACPERNYAARPGRALAVGRLVPNKNHRLLIEATALLKEQEGADQLPHLSIYGSGELAAELALLIEERGLSDRVCLAGISSQMPQLLKESDLYFMSSNNEGMSISLMEAMASGLPIIVTAVSGIKELIKNEESALVVPVADREAFAAAYLRLLREPDLRARLGRGAVEAVKPYSMAVCADRHLSLYNSLIRM